MSEQRSAFTARKEILLGLAQALVQLAGRVQTQGDAATDIAGLAARAEAIAAEAWALSTARMPAGDRAEALARDVQDFIAEATGLSHRAAREAAASREVAVTMQQHATELTNAAQDLETVSDIAAVRARLRPLVTALSDLPARLQNGTAIAAEVAELGTRAADISDRAEGLMENARTPGVAAVAIYRELRDFADNAGTIAAQMRADADRARESIVLMARQAGHLAVPEAAAASHRQATAVGRMHDVVSDGVHGRRETPPPRATAPTRGMSWSSGPRSRR